MPTAKADSTRELDFTFRLAGGSGHLSLDNRELWTWATVEHLELEVPDLAPPVDLSRGPELFQHRRTRVGSAALKIDQRQLDRLVEKLAPAFVDVGADRVALRPRDDYVTVSARVRIGNDLGELVATLRLVPRGGHIALVVDTALVFGFLPVPAPTMMHRLLIALTGATTDERYPGSPRLMGFGLVEMDVLRAFLWHAFPPRGWRLPDHRSAALISARPVRGSVLARFAQGSDGPIANQPGKQLLASVVRHRDAELAMADGDYGVAVHSYRTALGSGSPDQKFIYGRLLAIACSDRNRFAYAIDLAREALSRWPDFPAAHAAVASVRTAQGDNVAASERYRILTDIPEIANDDELTVRAALAGARLLERESRSQAIALYERVLTHSPGQGEATEALLSYYRNQEKWHDLVRLLRGRVAGAPTAAARTQALLSLAELYLDRLADPVSARDAANHALEEEPDSARAAQLLAQAHLAMGDTGAALTSMKSAAEKARERGDIRGHHRALLGAADLLARAGDHTAAADLYLRAATVLPGDRLALAGAAGAKAALGHHEQSAALWEQLLETSTEPPAKLAEYSVELGRALLAIGDVEGGTTAVQWATSRADSLVRLRAHALLAHFHASRDPEEAIREYAAAAESVAEEIVEPGSDDSSLRSRVAELHINRAELLVDQGRGQEAMVAYERSFDLASTDIELRTAAATASLHLAEREHAVDAERRWLDVLLSTDPHRHNSDYFLRRARLSLASPSFERDQVIQDLDSAVRLTDSDEKRADALAIKANLLKGAADPVGRAHALSQRIELADSNEDRARAASQAARAWLDADQPEDALRCAQIATVAAETTNNRDLRHEALLCLGEAAWRKRAWSVVVDTYRGLTAEAGDDPMAALLQHRTGIALDETGELEGAAEAFEEVLSRRDVPQDLRAATWRQLAGIYERLDLPEKAATALKSFASDELADVPDATRADAWYRAGELYRRLGEKLVEAESCLEYSLKLVSDHLPALDSLERIKREEGDYERVAVILGRKIAATTGHANRQKALLARLADLQHLRLGRTDVARATYARAMEIDPDFRPGLRFVAHDARESGNFPSCATALEQLARELESDLDLQDTAAQLAEERIKAALQLAHLATQEDSTYADQALVALEGNLAPDHSDDRILEGIERVLRSKNDWRGVADTLGLRASAAAGNKALSWDLERIDILSTRVGDKGAALAATRAALSRNPDDETLTAFIVDLAADGGDAEEPPPGTETIRPSDLRGLADQAYYDGDYAACAELLESLAAQQPLGPAEPGARRSGGRSARGELFLELADVYYDHTGDNVRARESMRRAAEAFGRGSRRDATLRLLATEAFTADAYSDANEAWRSIDPERLTASDRFQLARAVTNLGRDHEAIAVLEQARVRGSLSDDSAKLLSHLYRERQRKGDLADSLAGGAESSPPDIAETRLREALNLFENALANVEGAERVRAQITALRGPEAAAKPPGPDDLERAADAALKDGDSAVAADLLSRAVHERAGRYALDGRSADTHLLAALDRLRRVTYNIAPSPDLGGTGHFEALVRGLMSAAAVVSEENSISLLREASTVRRNQLRDPRGSGDALTRAFSIRPFDETIFAELSTSLREASDYTQLMAAYELHLEHLQGPARAQRLTELARIVRSVAGDKERVKALLAEATEVDPGASPESAEDEPAERQALQLAASAEEGGDKESAIKHYYAAFAERPHDKRPLAALERLYGELGDTEAQANVLGQLIEQTEDPFVRAELGYRRAVLYRDVLRREHEAYRCMKEAHVTNPENNQVANALRSLAMARGEWPLAAELLYREIASAPDARERAALQLELALIYDEKLLDPAQAVRNYRQALDLDPSIPAAPGPLARLYELDGRHAEAAKYFEMAATVQRERSLGTSLLRKAAICAEHAGLADEAHRLYALAADHDGDARDVERTETSEPSGQFEILERRLRTTGDGEERKGTLYQLLKLATSKGEIEGVRRHAGALLELDGTDLTAYLALKALAEQEVNQQALAELLSARAHAIHEPQERAALYYQLGRTYQDDLGDVNGAVKAYQAVLDAAADHPGALESLAQIAYLRSDWERARELFARISPQTCSLAEELIAFRRGEIAEMLGLDAEAVSAFNDAVRLAPGNRHALSALVRTAVRIGDMARAIEAARARMELLADDDISGLTAARLQLAQLCDGANDVVTAIYYFELVLAEDPNSRPALESLVTLYAAHGDHQGAIRTLRSLVAIATDLGERAERHYTLGEIFRANVGDHEAAAQEYIKAIDLDPDHAPTLRRLLDYFWTLDEHEELLEIANDLHKRDALVVIETPSPTLARLMLAAALQSDPMAQRIADSLPGDVSYSLAAAMVESRESGKRATVEELCAVARRLADQIAAIRLPKVIAHLTHWADEIPSAAQLVARLEVS